MRLSRVFDSGLHLEDVDPGFQVVGDRCQADLSLRSTHSTQSESRMSEDALLQRGKRVFDDGTSSPHGVWGGALAACAAELRRADAA